MKTILAQDLTLKLFFRMLACIFKWEHFLCISLEIPLGWDRLILL